MLRSRNARGAAVGEHLWVVLALGVFASGALAGLGDGWARALAGAVETAPRAPTRSVSTEAGAVRALRELAARPVRFAARASEADPLGRIRHVIPWPQIRATNVDAIATGAIDRANASLDRLLAGDPRPTFRGTVQPIDGALAELGYAANVLGHLDSVGHSRALSSRYLGAQRRLDEARAALLQREDVTAALREAHRSVADRGPDSPQRALTETLLEEAGVAPDGRRLPAATLARVNELRAELQQLELQYQRQLTDAYQAFEVTVTDEAALRGLSPEALREARRAARRAKVPGFRFTYDSVGMEEALTALEDSATRRVFWEALHRVGAEAPHDNVALAAQVLRLRQELASLRGYAHYADYAMRDAGPARRMVGSAAEAEAFVDDLLARVRPLAARELDEIRDFRATVDGSRHLDPWDVDHWSARLYEHRFAGLDETPYFTPESALEGAFKVAERLFGVRVERASLPKWHRDVRSYRVTGADGRLLGYLQADLYDRPAKHAGSWEADLVLGEGLKPSTVILNTEFAKPKRGEVALLDVYGASGLFHEVGHAMHALLSESPLRPYAGTNVALDFAEFPSQLFENWLWQKESLDLFARHLHTGERMPPDLVDGLRASRRFGAATELLETLVYAKMDLALHRRAADGSAAPETVARAIARTHALFPPTQGQTFLGDLDHVFGGEYGVGYYAYAYSEMLEADAFARFERAGILDRRLGRELRDEVLRHGAMAPARQLFARFMGRDPRADALLARLTAD